MRCLVVYCHPVPESYSAALRDMAVATLGRRGWDVRVVDLYAEGFDPVLSTEERRSYNDHAPVDPLLQAHIDNLRWAQALVFVYPTWWYGLPAMLKGWLDRVWATDVAFSLPPGGGPIISKIGHITRIAVVTTCGAPWWLSFLVGQPGRKTLLRGIRALCARRTRTLYLAHYDMDTSTSDSRRAFIEKAGKALLRL